MSAAPNDIFRRAALERLASPERLDRMVRITAPRDWIAAAALIGLAAMTPVWSVAGRIPSVVAGSGILVATGGRVVDATAPTEGTVTEIMVRVGDVVAAGRTIARIDQSALALSLDNARVVVAERAAQLDERRRQEAIFAASRAETLVARRRALDDRLAAAEARVSEIGRRLAGEEDMFRRRVITLQKLEDSREALAGARQSVLDVGSQRVQMEADEVAARQTGERDVRAAEERLADATRRLRELEAQVARSETVTSPVAGRVTEIKAVVGTRIAAGAGLVALESGAEGLQLVLYLPPDEGKRVRPGMDARISPATFRREEWGTMVGRVRDVSDFPASPQAMLAVLGNERLVERFSAAGAPIAATVDLVADPRGRSGLRWAGGPGPASAPSTGTTASAEVTVAETPPIAFVAPLLRRLLGVEQGS
ncbi:MAG: NHLP bacteriocin system secretion protein [Siculibacillus sp.]|nr:NHLP bacteriocin system secretion protein [Siculibacillus sp.]